LNEKIEGLVKKAEKSGMPYSILKKVYDRGMAAWKTGHRPGTTPQQWAFARVNSFVTKSSGTWGKADKDLADKVRGAKKESIENPKKAKDLIGQVREKLGKDADAGDYIKDFRKSKAPQFKGKSDKKIQKMAIAAYLDSKEEKDLEESLKLDEAVIAGKDYKYDGKGPVKISKKMYAKVQRDSKTMVKGKPYMMALNPKTQGTELVPVKFEEVDMQEENLQELINFDRQLKDPKKETMVMFTKGSDKGKGFVIDKKDLSKFEKRGAIRIESNDIQEMEVKYIHTKDPQGFMNTYQGTSASKGLSMLSKDSPRRGEYLIKGDKKNHDVFQKMLKNRGIRPEIKIMKEDNIQESGHQDVPSMKTQVQIAMDALQKMNIELGKLSDEDELPTWWTNKVATAVNKLDGMADYIDAMHDRGQKMNESNLQEQKVFVFRYEYKGKRYAAPFKSEKDAKSSMKAAMKDKNVKNPSITQDILKRGVKFAEDVEIVEFIDEAVLAGRDYKYDGIGPIKISKKMYAKVQRDSKGKDFSGKPYMMALNPKTQETELVPVKFEEVDNSLMAQATRVISKTSIKEKIDPADIDMKATAADRKAADKNIIIQLRRAQDMVKQTGRQDQTGIEFLDKKKQKIDSKIINKALDMFDKMKPNDKAKMQKTIGKSYRDLLKTVQRGRV
jgi:hypothetical protein